VNVPCPCLRPAPARRETDHDGHLHLLVWYYLRYSDPHNTQLAVRTPCRTDRWLPVDQYVGALSTRF